MLMLKSKELREQRAKLIADSRALLDKDKEFTPENRAAVEKMDKDIDQATKDIELYERQEQRERELATQAAPIVPGVEDSKVEDRKKQVEAETRKYSEAFEVYFRQGPENLTAEQRSILKAGFQPDPDKKKAAPRPSPPRAAVTPSRKASRPSLERALLQFGGVRQAARILQTSSGNVIPWPTVDDTANTGEDSTINTAASGQDITFGSVSLNAYKMDSGIILVPTELLEDTGIPLDGDIGSMIGERLGRRQNAKQTTGAGTGTFQGVTVGATAALTTTSPTAIAADELITFQHKVDPAYRSNPKCAWMMNDDTVRLIRQLKDSNNRYLLDYSTLPGMFTTLLGFKVITNQQMATVAATNISVLFGDFGKFIVRDVRGIVVRRLNELYATADQVAYIAWYRGDSRLVCASTKALVSLTQHA